jgi:hypothetical protein
MSELAMRESAALETYLNDPTGGRLIAWAQAAQAANQLAKALVTTTFVPKEFAGNPGDATAAILMGDELGLSPLAALRSIYTVHGTPAMYARTMVALAQSRGHQVWTEATSDARVIVCGQRRGSNKVERSEWTMDRARKAGYTNNKKYASNPQEMLYSKAAAEVCRKVAADVLAGVPFSVEDLELEQDSQPTTTTVKRETRTVSRKTAETVTPPEPELPDAPPADEPADPPANVTPEPITDPQMKRLQAHYKNTDRDERLAEASSVLDVDVTSFSDLTKDQASRLIDWLDGPPDGEAS